MPRRMTANGIALCLAFALAACAGNQNAARSSSSRDATVAPPATSVPTTVPLTQVPVPTSIDAQGKVTTQCVTLPANWQMCAAVNGDGSVETLTTIDARTIVNCVDATAATPQLPTDEYNIACRVFEDRTPTTQNPADLSGHPLLCALVNGGTLRVGTVTPSTLLNAPLICIDSAQSSVSIYRRGVPPMPCRQAGAFVDCRTHS